MKQIKLLIYTAVFCCTALLLLHCDNNADNISKTKKDTLPPQKVTLDASIPGNFSNQKTLTFGSAALPDFIKKFPEFTPLKKDLEQFYAGRNFAYAWYDNNGLIEQADNLFNRIEHISDEGLPNKIPYREPFHEMMNDNDSLYRKEIANADIELMLTAQYFSYARYVWEGMSETKSQKIDWFLPRKKINLQQIMDSLLLDSNPQFVATEPVYRQYGLLKDYLKKYREIQKKGGLTFIKADKRSYRPGDSSAAVISIRKCLFILGDIASDNGSALYDKELEDGVKRFQNRYGLKEDGITGPSIVKEINTPLSKRIEQLIVNLERCRWLPEEPKGVYFAVNIPAYTLYAYENDSLLWTMNVVVGKSVHKTVIFSGDLKYVVFSPYWNVPPGILKDEVLPAIRRDKNYLTRNHMEWNGNSVRQLPGPWNALGQVKFLFPNSHNIYLHDTPAKTLFGQEKRAFSHGCVRVSEPERLAQFLLRNDSSWTKEKIKSAMNASREQYVILKETVPVFIAYFTAFVDREGRLNFRDDVYQRDSRLAQMIFEKSNTSGQ